MQSRLQIVEGLYFGFCDLSIGHLWEELPDFFANLGMIVTCIDSTEKVSSSPLIQQRMVEGWQLSTVGQNAIYVPAEDLHRFMQDKGMFCGFDECFLTPEVPKDIPSDSGHFTTDSFNFGQRIPENFLVKFKSLGAIRYLADGCGLNFVTESCELAHAVLDVERNQGGDDPKSSTFFLKE